MQAPDEAERLAKAARAKALLKKHQKKKVGAGASSNVTSPLSVAALSSPPGSIFSPPASEAGDASEFGELKPATRPLRNGSQSELQPSLDEVSSSPLQDVSSRAELDNRQQTISLLVAEKATLSAAVQRLEQDEQRATQERQAALAKYQEKFDALNATIVSLSDELRSSKDAHADIIAREEQQLAKAREMDRELESVRRTMNETLARAKAHETRIRELEEEVQANDRVEALEKSLKGTQDRAESLEFQLSKSKQVHAKLKAELAASEEQFRTLGSSAKEWQDKHTALAEDHAAVLSSLTQLTAERDSIRARHDELALSTDSTTKEITQLQQLLSAAGGDVKLAQQQLQHAQGEATQAARRAEDAEKMQQDLQTENVELMASLNEMRPKIVELTQDKLALGEETERLQKTVRILNGTIAQLENSLHETRSLVEDRGQKVQASEERWRAEKAAMERTLKELEQGYVEAEDELHAARASVQELDAERTAHRRAVTQYEATMDRLQAEVDRQRSELESMSHALSESQTAAHEVQELLVHNQSELESLRTDAAYKGDEMLRLKDQLAIQSTPASPRVGQGETFDGEFLSAVQQQHALDLSTARSQIRSLENTLYQEQTKAHTLQRQVSALENELTTLRPRGSATQHLPPPRPVSAASNVSSSGIRRSTDSRLRMTLAPPILSIDASLTPETRHKRKVSLSMLKARIDSEREAPPFRHHALPVLAPTAEEPTPTAPSPPPPLPHSHSHSPHIISVGPVERSEFRDEAHIFWCHACSGDLVVL